MKKKNITIRLFNLQSGIALGLTYIPLPSHSVENVAKELFHVFI